MKRRLLLLVLIFHSLLSSATRPNLQWARQTAATAGSTSQSFFSKTVLDKSGNLLSCGTFSGTVDLDPSAAILNYTAVSYNDMVVTKMDPAGNLVWVKTTGPPGRGMQALSLATDTAENIYVTGYYGGTADFDPGIGVYNMTSSGPFDVFVLKLDKKGDFLWAITIGGGSSEFAHDIVVDKSGNIFLGGYIDGPTDLDPGSGTYSSLFKGIHDAFVLKLDDKGELLWATIFGDKGADYAEDLELDDYGNILITGAFMGTVDVDPGIGSYELKSPESQNTYVLKLSSVGEFLWARQTTTAPAESAYARSICRDHNGDIYVAGNFKGRADFNPGTGTAILTVSVLGNEIFLWKMDTAGRHIWVKNFPSPSASQFFSGDLAVDRDNNIVIGGSFSEEMDLDPGPGTVMAKADGINSNIFMAKFDPSGIYQWGINLGGKNIDRLNSLTISPANEIYGAGYFTDTVDFDPGVPIFNLISNSTEAYHFKFSDCKVNDTISLSGNVLNAKGTGTAYQWVKCPSYTSIPGATAKSYTVTSSGTYALIIDDGSCRDTSDCISVKPSSLENLVPENLIRIFPNPSTDGIVNLQLPENMVGATIKVCNIYGQKITAAIVSSSNMSLKLNSGFYFVEINDGKQKFTTKIIVQ